METTETSTASRLPDFRSPFCNSGNQCSATRGTFSDFAFGGEAFRFDGDSLESVAKFFSATSATCCLLLLEISAPTSSITSDTLVNEPELATTVRAFWMMLSLYCGSSRRARPTDW